VRSAEFDREYVLRSAMNEFISKGYNQTSMQDLKKATGLHPGSIYCAFENKRGLLIAALNHYAETKTVQFEHFFSDSQCIIDGFKNYLNDIFDHTECAGIKGCLLQKALSELQSQDEEIEHMILNIQNQWKQQIQTKLEQAKLNGEMPDHIDCEFMSDYIMMNIYGLRSFAESNPGKSRIKMLVQHLIAQLNP
jgi:TetR/AcrR family transcriptional regulator, transcriptional repressor for nem operon